MLSTKMVAALNEQIKHEFYSSYLYLSMAAYCDSQNLKGFAHWMKLQATEEHEHGMKIFAYLLENAQRVNLDMLERPPFDFSSPRTLFQKVLDHERMITSRIHKIYELAVEEKDYRTQIMLQWFVNEQIEEEANAMDILARIEMTEERSSALLWIDKDLAKRG